MGETLVVGAGLAGAVMAERLADAGERVVVVERREHIAGNTYDHLDEHGVLIHAYGPHVFHTNSDKVWEYLSRFTDWRHYEQRALALIGDDLLPIPINRTTLERFFRVELADDDAARQLLDGLAVDAEARTSEEICLARVGRELYEAFFRGYTRKQWARDPSELDRSVCARIPVRTDRDDRYFTDRHQAVPAGGYTAMVGRMLEHPRIRVRLGEDALALVGRYRRVVWTGPIDELLGHRLGRLPYRSVRFELRNMPAPGGRLVQPVAAINYPSETVPYTRETEFRHITGQSHHTTTIMREIPTGDGDPYYPVPHPDNRELYGRYVALARAELPHMTLVGRLARYQYLNMDQVVGQALAAAAGETLPAAA